MTASNHDWSESLRGFADILDNEGRHNGASVLRDAAASFSTLEARVAVLEELLDERQRTIDALNREIGRGAK